MDKDYYKILGVNESDSAEDIKKAYRKLARKWHPDVAGSSDDVLLKFKEINEAYEVLSDSLKKGDYDKARSFYNYARQTSESSYKKNTEYAQNPNRENDSHFKNFSKSLNEWFYENWQKQEKKKTENAVPKRGKDVYTDIEISVFEAINGTEKVINMLQMSVCPKCGGRKFINEALCQHCKGSGEVSEYKKFTIKIPAGIKNGSKIRLSKEGGKGENGGENGDLYVKVSIKEPMNYKTEGLNIIKTVYITPSEAVLGADIEVKTISGAYIVKIPANTQNGQKVRLTGCGIVQNNNVGDMIIVLEIRIPKTLSKEEIDLYKKLSELSAHNIRDSIYD